MTFARSSLVVFIANFLLCSFLCAQLSAQTTQSLPVETRTGAQISPQLVPVTPPVSSRTKRKAASLDLVKLSRLHTPAKVAPQLDSSITAPPALFVPDLADVNPQVAKPKIYTFATADFPGAAYSYIYDTNATTAVGAANFAPPSNANTAFSIKAGASKILTIPGASTSNISAINTAGTMAGYYIDFFQVAHGFVDKAGVITTIDYPGSSETEIFDINDAGTVVGQYFVNGAFHGFMDKAGKFTTIDVPGESNTSVWGINTAGTIVGIYQDTSTLLQVGFISSGGGYTTVDLKLLGAVATAVFGINDAGTIAGEYIDSADVAHGFVWPSTGLDVVEVPNAAGTAVVRVKNNGHITGSSTDTFGEVHGITGH
jgi:hypothetical protein